MHEGSTEMDANLIGTGFIQIIIESDIICGNLMILIQLFCYKTNIIFYC